MQTRTLSTLPAQERLSRAQKAFDDYYCQCFWHMKRDLVITEENFPTIIEELKLNGGRKGWLLAHELCR
jgi:hypothetical protein